MAIPIDLSGRVILVCGVGRGGIGGATARQVASAGATVIAVDKEQSIVDATIADIEQAGGRGYGIVADVTDPAQTDPLIGTIVKRHGRLDGVANVAGGTRADEWMPLEKTSLESYRLTVNLNLEYVFRVCRDAAAWMIENKSKGALVNVGSVSMLAAAPYHGPYGAAKSGIAALTRTMAHEWWPYGIRANTVSPGAVMTERVRSRALNPAQVEASGVIFTSPDELANGILFLLSDLASGISGQNLVVDSSLSTKFCAGSRPAPQANS
jgi:NAD(P)-dependent dehydrogenase (short-subunit alcohol dehydrogenase family)